jgi:hypothetical protein
LGFKCPLCLNVYQSIQALRLHVRRSHGDLWKKCPICNKELKCSIVHYRRIKDDRHRELWILTVSKSSEGSIRKIAEEIMKAEGGLNGMG